MGIGGSIGLGSLKYDVITERSQVYASNQGENRGTLTEK